LRGKNCLAFPHANIELSSICWANQAGMAATMLLLYGRTEKKT
jgi:hypothetical protein